MKNSRKPQKIKNIFSTSRITRLIFIAWFISLILTLGVTSLLNLIFPGLTSLNYFLVGLIFFGISFLFGMIIFYFLTKKTNAITKQINDAIHKIAKGDFSARLNFPKTNRDIDEVVNNFNTMAEELNSLAFFNSDFASNFSHEFKTPLASVKGYAEILSESENVTNEQKLYLKIIIDESSRLTHLAENVILLSKLDSDNLNNTEKFWLDNQLSECILLFDKQMESKKIQFFSDIDRIIINANEHQIKEVWINLLSNAIKFVPINGIIKISATEHGKFVFVSVENNGPNIDKSELKTIFNRYYQANKNNGGSGLGLSIAKRIVERHKGAIFAENLARGVRFVVKLPLNNAVESD